MGSVLRLTLRPAGMFLVTGTVLVLVGAIGLAALFSWRAILPGVLTPLILVWGGGVLLLFSAAHYFVARVSAVQMSVVLAATTLALVLAGMAFYFASARSMEAQLDSAAPTADAIVPLIIRSALCGIAALATFVINVALAFRKRRSVIAVAAS
jgi:hypothetical protein